MTQWEIAFVPILILLAGVIVTGLMYLPGGIDFHRKRDEYGVTVTILAAGATLIIFTGFAAISYGIRQETAFMKQRAAANAKMDNEMEALIAKLEAEGGSPPTPYRR